MENKILPTVEELKLQLNLTDEDLLRLKLKLEIYFQEKKLFESINEEEKWQKHPFTTLYGIKACLLPTNEAKMGINIRKKICTIEREIENDAIIIGIEGKSFPITEVKGFAPELLNRQRQEFKIVENVDSFFNFDKKKHKKKGHERPYKYHK